MTHFSDCPETGTKRMLFDGHPDFKPRVFARLATQKGMAFTFHPTRWARGEFDNLLD
jgi:hypothetical protein